MEEGEHKLCLVEPLLELGEERLLQIQMQLLEEVEDREALAAEVVAEDTEEVATFLPIPLFIDQEEMEATAELEAMEAAAVEEGVEGAFLVISLVQEWEVREVLAVLEGEVEAVELREHMEVEIMAVMVEQEVMAEVEGAVVFPLLHLAALTAMAALVVLD